jgi:MerR family transcriptional regulator, thiopeptide resistance regulator
MIDSMKTVGRLAASFGLSRSTLLYYDSIGLLKPSGRSPAGYRLYSDRDLQRLEQIVLLRGMGVSLEKMRICLDKPKEGVVPLLLERMFAINGQISSLRQQQKALLALIEADGSLAGIKSKLHLFADFGREAGVTEQNAGQIHRAFERASPSLHRRFLRYLGFTPAEIEMFIKSLRSH